MHGQYKYLHPNTEHDTYQHWLNYDKDVAVIQASMPHHDWDIDAHQLRKPGRHMIESYIFPQQRQSGSTSS
jgi:hypothetical protein